MRGKIKRIEGKNKKGNLSPAGTRKIRGKDMETGPQKTILEFFVKKTMAQDNRDHGIIKVNNQGATNSSLLAVPSSFASHGPSRGGKDPDLRKRGVGERKKREEDTSCPGEVVPVSEGKGIENRSREKRG